MKRKVKFKHPFLTALFAIIPILLLTVFANVSTNEQEVETGPKEITTDLYPVIKENNQIINPNIKYSWNYRTDQSNQSTYNGTNNTTTNSCTPILTSCIFFIKCIIKEQHNYC